MASIELESQITDTGGNPMRLWKTLSTSMKLTGFAVALFTLSIESVSAQFVDFDVVDGSSELTGAVPASNTFHDDFSWDFKSRNLSRAGFEDGTIYPFAVYPWFDPEWRSNEFKVTEHAGHDTALKAYWHSDSGDGHWELRGFSPAREELWWSFDLYVPEVHPDDPDAPSFPDDRSTVISQVWHVGVGPMMAAIMIKENNLKVMNHGGPSATLRKKEIPRGEWNEVILRIKPSLDDNGSYTLWYGGEKVLEKSGIPVTCGNADADDFTDDDRMIEGDYMLPWLGVYAQDVGTDDERTLFFDNITSYAGSRSVLRVEAENFHDYEDESNKNQVGFYRPDETVDIGLYMDDTGYEGARWHPRHGNIIYYVDATNETLERVQYDIEIPEAGAYRFDFRTASPDGRGKFMVSLDKSNGGSKKLDVIDVPDTTREQDQSPVEPYRIKRKQARGPVTDTLKSREDSFEWAFTTVRGPIEFLEPGDYTVTLEVKEAGFMLDWWEADVSEEMKQE